MQAKSSSSFIVSLTLHGFVVLMVFLTTMYVSQKDKEPPQIFELVAGPPTAPDELVAPALGNSLSKIKLEIPQIELPPDQPEPEPAEQAPAPKPEIPQSKPEPKKPEPVKPTPVKPTPVKPAPKPVPEKPKPTTTPLKEMKQAAKMSYQDYLKKHPTPKPPATPRPTKTTKVPRIDTQGIAGGVKGGSTANTKGGGGGKALTREEQSQLDTYISFLINALKEAHEPPSGVSDRLETRVTFDITASGTIVNPRIAKSSGNREFDESVLAAFRRVRSIGPTPNGKADTWTVAFRMRD